MRFTFPALLVLVLFFSGCAAEKNRGPKESTAPCCTATIRALVPEGTGTVYLTGNLPALGPWQPEALAMGGAGRERVVELHVERGIKLEYKLTLGSWDREALSPSGDVPPNHRLLIDGAVEARHEIFAFKQDPEQYMEDWQGSGVLGRLVYWPEFESAFLGPTRHVEIWLPPNYDEDDPTRYPVLYMHDGQNLFDPRIANTGVDWGVDEAVARLVEEEIIAPIIVVGAWCTAERGPEYSPWHRAPDYARFLIEELMPRVDAEFRTLQAPENTAVMGSSMGGLLSFYLVTHHPNAFGAAGCVSTHFPLAPASITGEGDQRPYILGDIEAELKVPRGARYWFDYGTRGVDSTYAPTHEAVGEWLRGQGLHEGRDFVIRAYPGAEHNEAAWRARLVDPLTFLFAGA